jgi:hypothetical protein
VLVRGTVANGSPGEKVTIIGTGQSGKFAKSVLTATVAADGTFSSRVRPLVQTVYVAVGRAGLAAEKACLGGGAPITSPTDRDLGELPTTRPARLAPTRAGAG